MNVGDYIKKLRTEAGYSQEQLGALVGVQRAAVQKWECGKVQNLKRETIKRLAEIFQVSPVSFVEDDVSAYQNIIPLPVMRKIPMLGDIACGQPILADDNIESYVDMPDTIHADLALRCKGDSMIDAHIYDGDIVYIRQQPTVENGQIAAVLIGEEATLKRFYQDGNTVTLMPCNPQCVPLVYTGSQIEEIHIIGIAVGFTSTKI
ncbi:MAG: helix-turn-helix domain-containing protein [Clostridia bacterium]|nr:helix-turn-helix domain-containing protein [Clostridia bacterium]